VGQVDPVRFRDEPKQRGVPIETPWPAGFANFERRFPIAVE
jgi:hypothetical protein